MAEENGTEYKVFVGGISWQMDDQALLKGTLLPRRASE